MTTTFRLSTTIGMSKKMFKEGTCPRCRQVIQVPDDREKVICMYCGEEIRVEEALGSAKEERKPDRKAYGEYFE